MKRKKVTGIERLKVRYGRMFILPWFIGILLFFLIPLISSIAYSFSEVSLINGVSLKFTGITNYKYIITEDPNFLDNLGSAVATFLTSLPIIVALSLIFAVLLNQKFRGRLFARAVFFLPVIIATGVVMQYVMNSNDSNLSSTGELLNTAIGAGNSETAMRFSGILSDLGFPDKVTEVLNEYITNVFNLIWNCGIQILLFVAGMQSIPDQLYEVSKIEGATSWEEFWYVTFPMLGNVILLVLIYTMVDLITDFKNPVMEQAYELIGQNSMYDRSSAVLWCYFFIVGIVGALLLYIYNRALMRRWN